jgi:hypothetical protein
MTQFVVQKAGFPVAHLRIITKLQWISHSRKTQFGEAKNYKYLFSDVTDVFNNAP